MKVNRWCLIYWTNTTHTHGTPKNQITTQRQEQTLLHLSVEMTPPRTLMTPGLANPVVDCESKKIVKLLTAGKEPKRTQVIDVPTK